MAGTANLGGDAVLAEHSHAIRELCTIARRHLDCGDLLLEPTEIDARIGLEVELGESIAQQGRAVRKLGRYDVVGRNAHGQSPLARPSYERVHRFGGLRAPSC